MIDEKKAVEEIKMLMNSDALEGHSPAAVLYEVYDRIMEMSKTGGWIPCSERLPEDDGYQTYLCTLSGELVGQEVPFTGMCGFENGKWDEECVNAWMPLPEPWKRGSETWAENQNTL